MSELCKIKPIGRIERNTIKTYLYLEKQYHPGLLGVENFSHLRIIYRAGQNPPQVGTIGVNAVVDKGVLEISGISSESEIIVYDLKAYIPVEDRVPELDESTLKKRNQVNQTHPVMEISHHEHEELQLSPVGSFEQTDGRFFLQLDSRDLEWVTDSSYIIVLWYFNRFNGDSFRKMLQCHPPYEGPKAGVFASRAPVRPNPLGISVIKVLGVDTDKGRIQIDQTDAFAHTPVLGLRPYSADIDCIQEVRIPSWMSHWPQWRQEAVENPDRLKGELIESSAADIELLGEFSAWSEPPSDPKSDALLPGSAETGFGQEEIDHQVISIMGASQNNLKHVSVQIPVNKMTVITGVSGSGKSSLAFDTLYAEGRRRYLQSLSVSARMAAEQLERPDVDKITNLLPAIAIEQKKLSQNPRSSVGTITDVYHHFRLLFARIGTRYCTTCGRAIVTVSPSSLAKRILTMIPGTRIRLYPGKRSKMDAEGVTMTVPQEKDPGQTIEMTGHFTNAYAQGGGFLTLWINDEKRIVVTERNSCTHCEDILMKMTPSLFNYNSPAGLCSGCNGMGVKRDIDLQKVIPKPELSLLDGASSWFGDLREFARNPSANWMKNEVFALAETFGVDLELPWNQLPEEFRNKVLYGSGDQVLSYTYRSVKSGRSGSMERAAGGAVNHLRRLLDNSKSAKNHELFKQFSTEASCPDCKGERLGLQGRMTRVHGLRFPDAASLTIQDAYAWVRTLKTGLPSREAETSRDILEELEKALTSLMHVGLYYLTLDRSVTTLSGGESQRIRLAGQLSSGLSGLLYVLDEPSIGLHPKDQQSMIQILRQLTDEGNTVVVVEHDTETMKAADYLIEIGPGAGLRGGTVQAEGTPEEMAENPNAVTRPWLTDSSGKLKKGNYRSSFSSFVHIKGASLNNLRNVDVRFPLGAFSCVTGVSGSGKSSLVLGVLVPAVQKALANLDAQSGDYESVSFGADIEKLIYVNQNGIGRSPRSNPGTYIGVFDDIRKVFGSLPEAKKRGFGAARFSFNDKEGRCPACEGLGKIKIAMSYMSDVWVECSDCEGRRYKREILEFRYKDQSIADVLEMDAREALEVFADYPKITAALKTLKDVGLDYLKLGQSAVSLSGGEAQRIKLAKELVRPASGSCLYVLDEPTTGLHPLDVARLLAVLQQLVEAGHSVIVIEHNLEMIGAADWIVDLGPEGGDKGGSVLFEGSRLDFHKETPGYTAAFLKN